MNPIPMNPLTRRRLGSWAIVLAAGLLAGCGDSKDQTTDPDKVTTRDPYPFVRIKLKNNSPNLPATGQARGTANGQQRVVHAVGPVAPGQEVASTPPGTKGCDGVLITVSFAGGPTLTGQGVYPGSLIGMVEPIEVTESGGTAVVQFANGQPAQTITLAP